MELKKKNAFNLLDKRWGILELEHNPASEVSAVSARVVGLAISGLFRFQNTLNLLNFFFILFRLRYIPATYFLHHHNK